MHACNPLPRPARPPRTARPRRFKRYAALVEDRLMPRYGASWHWAKIEPPTDGGDAAAAAARLAHMQAALAARFPLDELNAARARLDPKNILANNMFDTLLGRPGGAAQAAAAAVAKP
jgi:L-galactono-1,4-lactone dehydrogenase